MRQGFRTIWLIMFVGALLFVILLGFAQSGGNLAATARAQAAGPHGGYTPTEDECATCHRAHTGQGIGLLEVWPEEAACYVCHNGLGASTDIEASFTSNPNTATSYYSHPVDQTTGVHKLMTNEMASGDFGNASRHVECTDCHNPHSSQPGSTSPPLIQTEMDNVTGVEPNYAGAGAPNVFTWLNVAQNEYQVCYKCHSSFTMLPTYQPAGLPKLFSTEAAQVLDSRDMAREFNPANASFHPVQAQGKNTNMPSGNLINGWTQTSRTYCSDCHNNPNGATEGWGPHGSPRLHLLLGGQDYSTTIGPTGDQEICFQCHDFNAFSMGMPNNTNFRKGGNWNLHRHHSAANGLPEITCYDCHDTHGSEQIHLINFRISANLQVPAGYNSQTAYQLNGNGTYGCQLACHGTTHDGITDPGGDFVYP